MELELLNESSDDLGYQIANDSRRMLHDALRVNDRLEAWWAFALQRHIERQRAKLEEHLP
jgi:hypothetical protein